MNPTVSGKPVKTSFYRGLCKARAGLLPVLLIMPLATALDAQQTSDGSLIDLEFQRDLRYRVEAVAHGSGRLPDAGVEPSSATLDSQATLAQTQPPARRQSTKETDNARLVKAQKSRPDGVSIDEQNLVTLNFQGADIKALINMVSQISKKNFIVDPRVKGKVTLVSGGGLPADQLYDIFLSVLEVHNFAAIPSGTVVKIIPKNLVKQHPTPTSVGGLPEPSDEHLTHIIALEHASVQELLPILRPLLPPTAHIAPHAGSNSLIITGTAANINRTLRLIDRMDKEQRSADIRVIYLKHADAQKMSQVVNQTINAQSAANTKKGQPPAQISVQVDEGLNALIVQAPENEFPVIQALIDQLDIERPESGDVHVMYLKFAQAPDLVAILDGLSQPAAEGEKGAAPTAKVSIQADEPTNALIIRAEREDFESLQSVIEKLDVRRAQVFVEMIIAEVSFNKASEIGVDWQSNRRTASGADVSAGTGFSPTTGGFSIGVIDRLFENLLGVTVPHLQIVLRALRTDSNTNIISTPNLLTLDNETAEIVVGQEVPFVTGSFTTSASSGGTAVTSTDENSGTATTTGVVNPFQTIERKDVGLTLKITPQINDGGTIRLEIEQEVSSVSPISVQGASDLITDRRAITATVQVDDEQIIVLGGLIRDDSVDSVEWVPILGKIPLIGALFRKKRKNAVKNNLMIFLRPKIIRTPMDLAELTRERYEFLRTNESESLPDTRKILDHPVPVVPEIAPEKWANPVDER